ncbi:MAG: histidine kinase [Terracidiphilus sp.]
MNFVPLRRRKILLGSFLGVVLALGFIALRAYLQSPRRGLPYRDSFVQGRADEWQALGGTWELVNGEMRNNSDERGAKLLTGSPYWHNYSIEADVTLLGISGDAGLIIRSGAEEEGVNAYSGYYAGMRTRDNSLVLGRADHGWIEVTKQSPAPVVIRPFQWYHLKLLAYDCEVVAAFTAPTYRDPVRLGINDQDCVRAGRVGLRSYSSGGIWRNVVVRAATYADLVQMLRSGGGQGEPTANHAATQEPKLLESSHPREKAQPRAISNASAQSIESLRLLSFAKPEVATIRGVVVLTTPLLFVQDSTGGVYIPQPTAPPLKVGDEVEVTGEVHPSDFSSTLQRATVQVLWARTPVPPVSVTASQASTGRYDATFIEVHGRLTGKERGPDSTLVLDLDEGPQSFRAIMNPGRGDYLFSKLKLNSSLRLRGICVVDSSFTNNLTPFVLLLRSNEDLEVLAGPPWWNTGHVIVIVVAALLLALVFNFVYHRIAHWRLQGVLEERQRLAHEMHDTLAQSFAGIGFQLQAIRNGIPEQNSAVLQQLDLASNLVRHSHQEARRSIATLRPDSLESEDLLSALEICARRMVEGGSVQVVSQTEGDQRSIPLRIKDALYRIGQEAIANSVRHAKPTILSIRLKFGDNLALLQVEDNGTGYIPDNGLLGFGVRGMRRRAQSISAQFHIQTAPGEGTRVQITAPLPPRVTFNNWPKLFWRYAREHWIDARSSRQADSHSYR